MGKGAKEKKEKSGDVTMEGDTTVTEGPTYEDKLKFVSVIARPMASKKLTKKVYKLIKKGSKHKTYVRNGLKDVQARIRKGETGLVVFAGDVTPIEVMCHMPAVCEEKSLPYVKLHLLN
jgi:H/ACA ribonucleoprotein complex subunit 2